MTSVLDELPPSMADMFRRNSPLFQPFFGPMHEVRMGFMFFPAAIEDMLALSEGAVSIPTVFGMCSDYEVMNAYTINLIACTFPAARFATVVLDQRWTGVVGFVVERRRALGMPALSHINVYSRGRRPVTGFHISHVNIIAENFESINLSVRGSGDPLLWCPEAAPLLERVTTLTVSSADARLAGFVRDHPRLREIVLPATYDGDESTGDVLRVAVTAPHLKEFWLRASVWDCNALAGVESLHITCGPSRDADIRELLLRSPDMKILHVRHLPASPLLPSSLVRLGVDVHRHSISSLGAALASLPMLRELEVSCSVDYFIYADTPALPAFPFWNALSDALHAAAPITSLAVDCPAADGRLVFPEHIKRSLRVLNVHGYLDAENGRHTLAFAPSCNPPTHLESLCVMSQSLDTYETPISELVDFISSHGAHLRSLRTDSTFTADILRRILRRCPQLESLSCSAERHALRSLEDELIPLPNMKMICDVSFPGDSMATKMQMMRRIHDLRRPLRRDAAAWAVVRRQLERAERRGKGLESLPWHWSSVAGRVAGYVGCLMQREWVVVK